LAGGLLSHATYSLSLLDTYFESGEITTLREKTILFFREMAGPICKWVLAITLSAITTTTDDESEVMFY
jgi:hypothetical protein